MGVIKKLYIGAVLFSLAAIVGLYLAILERDELSEMIGELTRAANSNAPKAVDEYTILKKVYSEEKDIIYVFEVVGDVPGYDRDEHRKRLIGNFNIVMCKTPRFREELLAQRVRFIQKYFTPESKLIDQFIFSEDDCSNDP